MRAHTLTPICFAFAAMLSAAAPAAASGMYRWVDDAGSVHYSNTAPPEHARDVTLIDDATNTISSTERRTREILEIERNAAPFAARNPASAATAESPAVSIGSESPAPPSRASIAPLQAEAVRDPCLRSSDPKCHERHRAAYVPYLGYSPSAAAQPTLTGFGATSGGGAGGTLAGSAPLAPPKLTPPKASDYALPPGSDKGAVPLPPLRTNRR